MGVDASSLSNALRWSRVCLFVLAGLAASSAAAAAEQTTRPDCGVNALFILLRLQGLPVTVDRLDSVLPPRRQGGYSMAELAAAGKSLGLGLDGVRSAKGDRPLDRPAIAFIIGEQGGHFVVVRPVGTTGTMVQVIDPPSAPRILDFKRIVSSKPWTGRILLPRDPWIVRNSIALRTGTVGLILLVAGLGYGLKTAHRQQSG